MAMQGYSSAPGRNAMNAAGTSPPRSVSTRPVPLIFSNMKPGSMKDPFKAKARSK